jgi:hypothetical protein
MVLYYSLGLNVPPEAAATLRVDAYVALAGPKGLRWYVGQNRFSDRMLPVLRDAQIASPVWGTAAWIPLDKTWARGPYVWIGGLCAAGSDPLVEANRLSNLAYAPFAVLR